MIRLITLFAVIFGLSHNKNMENLPDFKNIYQSEYKTATLVLRKNKPLINQIGLEYYTDTKLLTAIGFPELIRFQLLKDFFETSGLEILYINKGKEYADFSIGYYQMKPSFAEDLENYILSNNALPEHCKSITTYLPKNDKEIRKERIARLKSFSWQLKYMACFCVVMDTKTRNMPFQSFTKKLKYYATAYNTGFLKPDAEIRNSQLKSYFPYGPKFTDEQYKYADVSEYFIVYTYSDIF